MDGSSKDSGRVSVILCTNGFSRAHCEIRYKPCLLVKAVESASKYPVGQYLIILRLIIITLLASVSGNAPPIAPETAKSACWPVSSSYGSACNGSVRLLKLNGRTFDFAISYSVFHATLVLPEWLCGLGPSVSAAKLGHINAEPCPILLGPNNHSTPPCR